MPTQRVVDAINAFLGGTALAQAQFEVAAQKLASADLPTAAVPDVTSLVAPDISTDVDPAEQIIAVMVAADMHHATTAALRSALTLYQSSVDLLTS